jgi:hypothetical protein
MDRATKIAVPLNKNYYAESWNSIANFFLYDIYFLVNSMQLE